MSKFKVEQYIRMLEEKIDKIEEEKHDYDYNSDARIRLEVQVASIMSARNDLCRIFSIKSRLIGEDKKVAIAKTAHQRLLELGWVALNKANGVLTYLLNVDGSLHPERIELSPEGKRYYTTLRVIDLELAEVLVDYLKELQDE